VRRKGVVQVILGGVVGQVAYKQLIAHADGLLWETGR
jgi:hypothetical protein